MCLVNDFLCVTEIGLMFTWVNINTLRLRQNYCHFIDDIFKSIFVNEIVWISIKISLKFVPKVQIHNIPALVQIMAWCWPGDNHYLNQWWLVYWHLYAPLGLNALKCWRNGKWACLKPCVVVEYFKNYTGHGDILITNSSIWYAYICKSMPQFHFRLSCHVLKCFYLNLSIYFFC